MRICLFNGYIIGYSKTTGQDVSDVEWERIQTALDNRPEPEEGFQVMLRADTLAWEQIPMPQGEEEEQDPELSDSEALAIILGGAT
jgi:hypothetical protein